MRRHAVPRIAGQSVVEFALVAPLLFTLLLGTLEFGWLLYSYHEVTNAARDGARYAIVRGSRSAGILDPDSPAARRYRLDPRRVEAHVRQHLALPDPERLSLELALPDGDMVPGHRVRVTVTYTFRPLLGFVLPLPAYTLDAASTMIVHY